ncbi:DUF4850 domain-containing protein [Paenibacillus albidus]|uniref:DUF4850 domain-containing protein n=1 Tax=Paenibacillus albidus TaxID=2041023 RepID=UPI001BECAE18|nr:DUF4850 domain-containing protein [Paenibacillus albidus]MBT2291189.1 DUF4850 domain-containing protein [Paenibacillus albidus]
MNKPSTDWEKQLASKPFKGNHFTPQMQQDVEQRVNSRQRRRPRTWTFAGVLGLVLAVALFIGYAGIGRISGGQNLPGLAAPSPAATGNGTLPGSDAALTLAFPSADGSGEVVLPLQVTRAVLHVDDGTHPVNTRVPELPQMSFPIAGELADQLEAVLVYRPDMEGGYLLLAPAGWQASALVGANGSYGVTLQNPDDPGETLHYTDNAWGCAGCAIGSIGTYFPGKAAWAEEQGFSVSDADSPEFVERYVLGTAGTEARTVRYTLAADAEGYEAAGSAYYEEGEGGYLHRQLEIRLTSIPKQQQMLDTIMSFFAVNQGPPRLPPAESKSTEPNTYTIGTLVTALQEQGMKLSGVMAGEEQLFQKKLNGVWPDELIIDRTDSPSRPERLSVYTYADQTETAAGLDALKLEINRTTYDGGARIYPHVFRGANLLVVYWTGGDSEVPFHYDKTIKQVLLALEHPEE